MQEKQTFSFNSKQILLPLIDSKIDLFKQQLLMNQSSEVQITYFNDKIEKLEQLKNSVNNEELDVILHQPLKKKVLEEKLLSNTFENQEGCFLNYNMILGENKLKVVYDTITFQINVYEHV